MLPVLLHCIVVCVMLQYYNHTLRFILPHCVRAGYLVRAGHLPVNLGGTMPIPVATRDQALAALRLFETTLALAAAEQKDPKEVYWAAEDLLILVSHSRHKDVSRRAGRALDKIVGAAAPGPNRDAIEQAIAGVEYRHPAGTKPKRNPRPAARAALADAECTTRPATIN